MAQLVKTLPNFNMTSSWEGYYDPPPTVYYQPASTATANKDFDISDLPAGAILTGASLEAVLGSPYTGAALRTVDGTTYYSPRDVLLKIQALSGNYADLVRFVFRFKANGGTGGFGGHSAVLGVDNLTLTIDYIMPISTGSLNYTEREIGQTIRLQNIVRQDAGYTTKAVWTLLGQGEQIQNVGTASYTDFTLPASWLSILSAATSGQASVRLETYSAEGTLLGSISYTFTANVAALVIPTISSLAAAKYSDTTPAVPGAWDKFVKTKSKAMIYASVAAGTESSVKSVRVECAALGFVAYALPCTTGLLTAAGTFTFTVTVTDQRDRVKALTIGITVEDYSPPAATNVSFARAPNNGNPDPNQTYIRGIATISGTPYGALNPITAKAYYRQSGTSTWYPAGGQAVTSGAPFWMGSGGINVGYTYEVKVEVTDYFGPIPITGAPIPTAARLWDFRVDRAALGRYASNANEFSLPDGWESRYKGQTLDVRFANVSHNHSGVYASVSHTHNYAGSASAGGAANSALSLANDSAYAAYTAKSFITSGDYAGLNGWASHLHFNHGDASYYQDFMIPYWAPPMYSRLESGVFRGPWMMYSRENLQHGTVVPALADGYIYIKHA